SSRRRSCASRSWNDGAGGITVVLRRREASESKTPLSGLRPLPASGFSRRNCASLRTARGFFSDGLQKSVSVPHLPNRGDLRRGANALPEKLTCCLAASNGYQPARRLQRRLPQRHSV